MTSLNTTELNNQLDSDSRPDVCQLKIDEPDSKQSDLFIHTETS